MFPLPRFCITFDVDLLVRRQPRPPQTSPCSTSSARELFARSCRCKFTLQFLLRRTPHPPWPRTDVFRELVSQEGVQTWQGAQCNDAPQRKHMVPPTSPHEAETGVRRLHGQRDHVVKVPQPFREEAVWKTNHILVYGDGRQVLPNNANPGPELLRILMLHPSLFAVGSRPWSA
jgi:hypothetical protein